MWRFQTALITASYSVCCEGKQDFDLGHRYNIQTLQANILGTRSFNGVEFLFDIPFGTPMSPDTISLLIANCLNKLTENGLTLSHTCHIRTRVSGTLNTLRWSYCVPERRGDTSQNTLMPKNMLKCKRKIHPTTGNEGAGSIYRG
jgi:hypothetical protein